MAQRDPPKPSLVVFDLDMCFWEPEMYTLSAIPTPDDAVRGDNGFGEQVLTLPAHHATPCTGKSPISIATAFSLRMSRSFVHTVELEQMFFIVIEEEDVYGILTA